jgi:hypothetical protein
MVQEVSSRLLSHYFYFMVNCLQKCILQVGNFIFQGFVTCAYGPHVIGRVLICYGICDALASVRYRGQNLGCITQKEPKKMKAANFLNWCVSLEMLNFLPLFSLLYNLTANFPDIGQTYQ